MLGHVGARLIRQAKTSSHYFDIVLVFIKKKKLCEFYNN